MTSIHCLRQRRPVAFIVYVPNFSEITTDLLVVERRLRGLEDSVADEMIAYTESPKLLFTSYEDLSANDQKVRRTNLQAIDHGDFELLVIAGTAITEYVRSIIHHACLAEMDMSVYAEEDSLLMRYLYMQQSGV